jgi:uncharacterized protein YqgV (UPF0045/DUF77 family)
MSRDSFISVQISVYPLGIEDLMPGIGAFLSVLRARGVEYEFGPMSTVIHGEADQVWPALQEGFAAAESAAGRVVMTMTVSNACPVPGRE